MITPAPSDPPELDHILWSGFSKGKYAFDVGANCGQTIDVILKSWSEVVAFEPSVEAFAVLESRYADHPNVGLCSKAVSAVTGTIDLMAAPSKIATGQLVTHGTAGMEWSDDEMANGVLRTLSCVALDDFCLRSGIWPTFIKIDVEGHEDRVLEGMFRLLGREPEMLIEVHSETLGERLAEMLRPTHRLELIRHPHYEPGSLLSKTHFWYKCFPLHEEVSNRYKQEDSRNEH